MASESAELPTQSNSGHVALACRNPALCNGVPAPYFGCLDTPSESTPNDSIISTWRISLYKRPVKMYAKNIVGAGKIQFMVNGKEVAWVRAVDETDAKLREANGFYYLVRTVRLVPGQKNALEIYVDGERIWRAAYAG